MERLLYLGRSLAPLSVVAVLLALMMGCGGDDSDGAASQQATTGATVAQPTVPPATTTQPPATPTEPAPAAGPKPTPAAPTASPNACETSQTISRLKFKGLPCEQAATVANAWDSDQDNCNTIDDPNSPEGYTRNCEAAGYICQAKRDVKSDARFVACAKGQAQIRFTWAPP